MTDIGENEEERLAAVLGQSLEDQVDMEAAAAAAAMQQPLLRFSGGQHYKGKVQHQNKGPSSGLTSLYFR